MTILRQLTETSTFTNNPGISQLIFLQQKSLTQFLRISQTRVPVNLYKQRKMSAFLQKTSGGNGTENGFLKEYIYIMTAQPNKVFPANPSPRTLQADWLLPYMGQMWGTTKHHLAHCLVSTSIIKSSTPHGSPTPNPSIYTLELYC